MRPSVLAAAAAVLGGCYSPTLRDCSITCAADGSCPSGETCGADLYCHVDPTESCALVFQDAGRADARPAADAPGKVPDAATGCLGADTGEPDNTCPGEVVGPILEGQHVDLDNRRIFPAGDVDVYETLLALLPHSCGSSHDTVSYAFMVTLQPPPSTVLSLQRITQDNRQCRPADANSLSLCIEFSEPCNQTPQPPTFLFQVSGRNGAASCTPYTLDIRVCAAGSSCNDCKQL